MPWTQLALKISVTWLDGSVRTICAYLGGRSEINIFPPPIFLPLCCDTTCWGSGKERSACCCPQTSSSVHNISSGAWGDETSLTLLLDAACLWGSLYPTCASPHWEAGSQSRVGDWFFQWWKEEWGQGKKCWLMDFPFKKRRQIC